MPAILAPAASRPARGKAPNGPDCAPASKRSGSRNVGTGPRVFRALAAVTARKQFSAVRSIVVEGLAPRDAREDASASRRFGASRRDQGGPDRFHRRELQPAARPQVQRGIAGHGLHEAFQTGRTRRLRRPPMRPGEARGRHPASEAREARGCAARGSPGGLVPGGTRNAPARPTQASVWPRGDATPADEAEGGIAMFRCRPGRVGFRGGGVGAVEREEFCGALAVRDFAN